MHHEDYHFDYELGPVMSASCGYKKCRTRINPSSFSIAQPRPSVSTSITLPSITRKMHLIRFSILCSSILALLSSLLIGTQAINTDSDGSSIALIRNKIALYSILIDTKDFAALDQVYTQGVSPNTNGNLTTEEDFLREALTGTITLHYSDTQYVKLGPTRDTAKAISYVQAVYLAPDVNTTGQTLTYYERFLDDFVYLNGDWLIQNRTLEILVSRSCSFSALVLDSATKAQNHWCGLARRVLI